MQSQCKTGCNFVQCNMLIIQAEKKKKKIRSVGRYTTACFFFSVERFRHLHTRRAGSLYLWLSVAITAKLVPHSQQGGKKRFRCNFIFTWLKVILKMLPQNINLYKLYLEPICNSRVRLCSLSKTNNLTASFHTNVLCAQKKKHKIGCNFVKERVKMHCSMSMVVMSS